MKERLALILTIVVILGLLVILSTLTYVKQETEQDYEAGPNRSTFHAGPTGTRAFYDFLSESGYKVMRWREAPGRLFSDAGAKVTTFVVIGTMQVPYTEEEASDLMAWVEKGGRLVLVDRNPDLSLIPEKGQWDIQPTGSAFPTRDIDPGDTRVMTHEVIALQPVQTTVLTESVRAVLPSRFASYVKISEPRQSKVKKVEGLLSGSSEDSDTESTPGPYGPVVHIGNQDGALLLDYSYGAGRFVWLSDPYVVANGGIALRDNLQVAINSVAGYEGLIAFDEFHQGKAINQSALASYFSGTPVFAIGAQVVLLILVILWTNSRRFGRALPLPQVDRRSSLEFVASMAELQERSRAFDLAIENIYTRTRRVLARYAGVEYNTSRAEIARRVASRSTLNAHQLETLMKQCEEAINGQPINSRQSIDLVRRLREVERTLGLRMRSRDARQAVEHI